MEKVQIQSLLKNHVPEQAAEYCFQLWRAYPFLLKLRKNRISKLGDFSCRPGKTPQITINQDSHPFSFLITYVHEVSHLVVYKKWGWRVNPHGSEWKQTFRELFQPILTSEIFPAEVLVVLQRHLKNPRASSFSDVVLSRALRPYDQGLDQAIFLSQIPEGSQFEVRGRWFTKGPQKRTRVVCRELKTKRNYLIPIDTQVGLEMI